MNKIITVALIAGGMLLLDAPQAAAHKQARNEYRPPAFGRYETPRARKMPVWLKQNRSFRKWYKQSRLRRNRHLGWYQLFRIYRWERAYRMHDRRHHRHVHNDGFHRHDDRYRKRDKRRYRS